MAQPSIQRWPPKHWIFHILETFWVINLKFGPKTPYVPMTNLVYFRPQAVQFQFLDGRQNIQLYIWVGEYLSFNIEIWHKGSLCPKDKFVLFYTIVGLTFTFKIADIILNCPYLRDYLSYELEIWHKDNLFSLVVHIALPSASMWLQNIWHLCNLPTL